MKKRGIIVDDATVMRIRLREILESDFEIIAEAKDGKEAVMACKSHKPDFVTMDITMAQMNGMEALEQILKDNPDINVVMVSAVGQKKMVYEALSKGAKDFIIKPFEKERILTSIKRLFE